MTNGVHKAWRSSAVILALIVVLALITIFRSGATVRELLESIDRLEGEVLFASRENTEIRESLGRQKDLLRDAQSELFKARGIARDIADFIDGIAKGDSDIDQLIREIADQVRRDLGGIGSDEGNSSSSDP